MASRRVREDGVPRYQQIADELREAIRTGALADGDRIPGENHLMAQYGVARMTARQALDVLKNEGIAVAKKGSGVFVRLFNPIQRRGAKRLSRDVWGQGKAINSVDAQNLPITVDRLQVGECVAPTVVAQTLGIEVDEPVLYRKRRFIMSGQPVQLATSYLPLDVVSGTQIAQKDTGPGGTYARLAELGHEPVRFLERVRARMPHPDEVEALEVPAGTPVVLVTRYAYTQHDRVVEVNEITLNAFCYELDYEFTA